MCKTYFLPPTFPSFFLKLFVLVFVITSCSKPTSLSRSRQSSDARFFTLEKIFELDCKIKTKEEMDKRSYSSAQHFSIESDFSDFSFIHPTTGELKTEEVVINNFSKVKYLIEGPPACNTLLGSLKLDMVARPHSTYKVLFQINKTFLNLYLTGSLKDLPIQKTVVPINDNIVGVPLGSYPVDYRKIQSYTVTGRPVLTDAQGMYVEKTSKGLTYVVPEESDGVIISNISRFINTHYVQRKDVYPKNYFKGVWYSSISTQAADPLFTTRSFSVLSIPGFNLTTDNYSGRTDGQKVYFKFESDHLKVLNYNYYQQGVDVNSLLPAESEVFSIPITNVDFMFEDDLSGERTDERLPWDQRKYAHIMFSNATHYFGSFIYEILDYYNINPKSPSLTFKTLRLDRDYFDFVIYDGYLEYRFAFRRQAPSDYKKKTLHTANKNFNYFYIPDKRIFTQSEDSFKDDLEQQVLLLRIHPNENNEIQFHFSNSTPKDDLVRSIGREAISIWNQALQKAQLSIRLVIDESKDVSIGDNRYHILNLSKNHGINFLAGIAQFHTDDQTGELISTISNLALESIIDAIKYFIIQYAHNHSQSLTKPPQVVSYSSPLPNNPVASLKYFDILNKVEIASAYSSKKMLDLKNSFNLKDPDFDFLLNTDFINSSFYKQWKDENKISYALNTSKWIEQEQLEHIKQNMRHWNLEKWNSNLTSSGGHLFKIISKVCHFLPDPYYSQADVFKQAVQDCADKIYPIYALDTMVHEIGHSVFALRHNFLASSDVRNFIPNEDYSMSHMNQAFIYQDSKGSQQDLMSEFRSLSSSVMDYIHLNNGAQFFPGGYDIAAIQHLYSDYIVDKTEGNLLYIKESYQQCSEESVNTFSYCLRHDQGNTPEDITKNEITRLIETFQRSIYSLNRINKNQRSGERALVGIITRLSTIYFDWRKKIHSYILNHTKKDIKQLSAKEWNQLISDIIRKGSSAYASFEEKELLSFYKSRNLIYHALSYLSFIPNRYCVLEDLNTQFKFLLELSKVNRQILSQSEQQSLTSCFKNDKVHPEVQKYINQHFTSNIVVKEEIGYFLEDDLPSKTSSFLSLNPSYFKRYNRSKVARTVSFLGLSSIASFHPEGLNHPRLTMLEELDIYNGVKRLLIARSTLGVFYPQISFSDSIKDIPLENLTPEKSANILFGFPNIKQDGRDPLFQDVMIVGKEQPLRTTSCCFSPNFKEEGLLLSTFNTFFQFAEWISNRKTNDSLYFQYEWQTHPIDVAINSLTQLQSDTKFFYTHYTNVNNLIISSKNTTPLSTSYIHTIVRELSYNSIAQSWAYRGELPENKSSTQILTTRLLEELRNLALKQEEGSKKWLHFSYAYTLSLFYIKSHLYFATIYPESISTIHNEVERSIKEFNKHFLDRESFKQLIKLNKDLLKLGDFSKEDIEFIYEKISGIFKHFFPVLDIRQPIEDIVQGQEYLLIHILPRQLLSNGIALPRMLNILQLAKQLLQPVTSGSNFISFFSLPNPYETSSESNVTIPTDLQNSSVMPILTKKGWDKEFIHPNELEAQKNLLLQWAPAPNIIQFY